MVNFIKVLVCECGHTCLSGWLGFKKTVGGISSIFYLDISFILSFHLCSDIESLLFSAAL